MSNAAENSPEPKRFDPLTQPVKYLTEPVEDPLRPHVYDGIQEYDKRLPNWWLVTLWGTIAFSVLYWLIRHQIMDAPEPGRMVEAEMKANQAIAARSSGVLTDDLLWQMSRDPNVVAAGLATYTTTCVSCHLPDLTGLIGPNLVDHDWIHGGEPMEMIGTIEKGVLEKGMPAWGPILGKQKISEVAAFILNHHTKGEETRKVFGWVPGQGNILTPPAAPAPPALAH